MALVMRVQTKLSHGLLYYPQNIDSGATGGGGNGGTSSQPQLVCVLLLFFKLISMYIWLDLTVALASGGSQWGCWRWPVPLRTRSWSAMALAMRKLAPVMQIRTLGDGSGDARLQQRHKSSHNIHPISCAALLRCSRVLCVVLLACSSV